MGKPLPPILEAIPMPKYSVAQYGLMTREEKSKIKPLPDVALLFDGKRGLPYRQIRIYICK